MESTSCGQNCPFVKNGSCKSETECPNYVESWWMEGQETTPKLLKDCSPKRLLLQQQYLQLKVEQFQSVLDQTRADYSLLTSQLKSVIEITSNLLESHVQLKLNEVKNENITCIGDVKPL